MGFFTIFLAMIFVFSAPSWSGTVYQIDSEKSSIRYKLAYSLGFHSGKALWPKGRIEVEEKPFRLVFSEISLPISAMSTGSEKRDCHMREALGLDYSKSAYPKEHVCDSENRMPSEGANAAIFTEIHFKGFPVEAKGLDPDFEGEQTFRISGSLEIHGVKNPVQVDMKLSRHGPQTMNATGGFDVKLSDYGITVKPFLLIAVKDSAHVDLDLKFVSRIQSK